MRRVNVNFSEEAYATLEAIATRRGCTVSDLVREAINMEKWLEDMHQQGSRLLVERDGQLRELVWRRFASAVASDAARRGGAQGKGV